MGQAIYKTFVTKLPCVLISLSIYIYDSHTKTCMERREGFEYAYDYLLHQIIKKAELRKIVEHLKQNLGQRYKQVSQIVVDLYTALLKCCLLLKLLQK